MLMGMAIWVGMEVIVEYIRYRALRGVMDMALGIAFFCIPTRQLGNEFSRVQLG
jgi:hypothetical protein